jgi:hypothetical protein
MHAKPDSGISGPQVPDQVRGPLPAVFGTDTITFTFTYGNYDFNGTINRLTGAFVMSLGAIRKWTCQPGQKQF